jgi:penicillin-binding protein 1C
MQLVRLLRPKVGGWRGKLGEAAWALRLDAQLTKDAMLEQYLNRVHLGQGAVGVAAASRLYFGAPASNVSVAEAAMLAGLAHAPSRDNPLSAPAAARARRRVALARMRRHAMITEAEAELARTEPVASRGFGATFLAPHFTTRLVQLDARVTRDVVRARTWRATLDAGLQEEVEAEVRHAVAVLRDRSVQHAAAVVLDNASGDVLAWVGSPDFWEPRRGQTDMVVSPRQPGSALKPFLFALAFDRGLTAASILPDIPRSYPTAAGAYAPRNYDRRFRGPVSAREALASSYNVPAVELASRVGENALLEVLRRAGFASLDREAEHYGLGLALGNGEVSLIELANGYRALASGGEWRPWRWLADGPLGSTVQGASDIAPHARIASPEATALVLDILADPAARVPGFGLQTPFNFPFPVAVKTGTSRHFTDNWAVAVTGGFTVAVWVGNFSGQPMQGVSGVSGAGPLLNRVVSVTADRYAPGELTSPGQAGLRPVNICRISGLLPSSRCAGVREWFIAGTEPTSADDWVQQGRIVLPAEYAEWSAAEASGFEIGEDEVETDAGEVADGSGTSGFTGTVGVAASAAPVGFRVVSPADGDILRMPPGVPARYATIALRAAGTTAAVRWFIDDVPFEGARWSLSPGEHLIRAESADGEVARARVTVQR